MPATTSCCVLMNVFNNPSTVPPHGFQPRKLQLHPMPRQDCCTAVFLCSLQGWSLCLSTTFSIFEQHFSSLHSLVCTCWVTIAKIQELPVVLLHFVRKR